MHKNSQKRIYMPGAAYFITTVTHGRWPYFEDEVLCELFSAHLNMNREMHEYRLHAYAIMSDHVHIMLEPGEKSNYSTIMGSLKRCFSRDVNALLGYFGSDDNGKPGDDHDRRLVRIEDRFGARLNGVQYSFKKSRDFNVVTLNDYYEEFRVLQQHYAVFQWQKSFHHRIIYNENQMEGYLKYIAIQPFKHGSNDRWVWINMNSGR